MKKLLLLLLSAVFAAGMTLFVACGGGDSGNDSGNKPNDSVQPDGDKKDPDNENKDPDEGKLAQFTGITFADKTVTYDGNEHTITVSGTVPEDTEVKYTNNKGTDAGEYKASVTLTKEGYKTLTLNATLKINPLEFTGLTFEPVTVVYNGEPHILGEVEGAPEGTKITYTGREAKTDAGTYKATAKLEKANYKTKEIEATLTIERAEFTGLTYESVSVKYDGADHIGDVKLVGFPPEGTTQKLTVKNSDGLVVNTAIGIGTYSYTLELTNKNYNKAVLEATLKISAEKTNMPVFASGDGTIYFANGLDNRYVYSLAGNELTRIDTSTPKEFNRANSSSALFITGSLFLNSVKEFKDGSVNVLYTDGNIDDFVKYSDTVYYYSSNSLTASKSGIYKVVVNSNDEPTVTQIFTGKSDNLSIYGTYLYFTNGNDRNYLYRMSLSNNTTELVLSEKVHEYIIDNNKLYCTVNGTLNDYIGYIDLSSSSTEPTKLTNNAGEFLRVKGGYLYYHYTDLFSIVDESKKGIWSINLSTKADTQILEKEVNGFDLDASGNIVYIDTNDLHLYRYNASTKKSTDLLAGFEAPETTPVNTGGRTVAYGNKVYYLNMYAGKTLYVYDETTKTHSQLTANKVADFYIYGDTLYFNQVTMLTNNDLYSVNLKTGSEAVKLSSNDVREMVRDGNYLYATHYNWAGQAGGISRMSLDGTEYVKFSEVNGAKNLTIKDGKLYFINCATGQDNGYIEYYELSAITATSEKLASTRLSKDISNVKQFIFDGNDIFYLYNGTLDNSVRRTDFTSLGEGVKLASSKTNPNEMIAYGNYIYYYSYASTAASSAGFYKVSKDATKDGTQELILGYAETYYGSDFAITSSGNLYFLNYIPKLAATIKNMDAHTYQLNLADGTVTKIA